MSGIELLTKKLFSIAEDTAVEQEKIDKIKCALDTLTPRQKAIIQRRYGIGHDKCDTALEIGAELEVTSTRVENIEEKALAILQQAIQK